MEDKPDKTPVVKGFKAFSQKPKPKESKEPKERELTAEELQTIRMISGLDEEPVNKYVQRLVTKMRMFTDRPERQQALKDCLKNYVLLKKNRYLNRTRKTPTEDDLLVCDCVSSFNIGR